MADEGLRMSDANPPPSLAQQLSGRWQIPLLAVSIVMLLAGIWRLRPQPKPPTFDQLLASALALADAGLYPEASEYTELLLADPARLPDQRRALHGLMAKIIFAHEQGNVVHGPGNAQGIIEHTDKALAPGESHDAEMHWIRAEAWAWLHRPMEALAEYEQAVTKGAENIWEIRKRVIEIRRAVGGATAEQLHAAYDPFLTDVGPSDELRYWAAQQKVELYGLQGEHEQAERFLAGHVARFRDSALSGQYDYLQALAWFHLQRLEDAERLLRALRDGLVPGHELYARSGWLLGKILQAQEAPEFALSSYEDVLEHTTPGPYWTASMFGRAETLAAVERFDESVEAYAQAIRLTAEDPYASLVDLRVVRESTTAWYQRLLAESKLPQAMAYLRIAATLVPAADNEKQAVYSRRLADLAFALGKQARARADAARAPHDAPDRLEAKGHLIESGQQYLRLAKLVSLDGPRSSEATWRAAEAFDEAGDRRRAAEVLEVFVRERPMSPQTPRALHRLGLTYQALGQYDQAIAKYQQSLQRFPRTLAATASLVPLADCFIEIGDLEKARQTLLRIVGRRPDDPIKPIEPVANEYRDALFKLADLHMRSQAYEEAIARYEETIERYDDDPRSDRATFLLADAYRRSAILIRRDMSDNKNVAYKDHLRATHQERLRRAGQLYDEVIDRYLGRSPQTLTELDRLWVKLSHLYRADAVYDRSRVFDASDLRPYAEAMELYDRAAWVYQNDPIAMSAYVQMINCHLRLGDVDKARMRLERAKWALKSIPDQQFRRFAPREDRVFWEGYLSWLERTGTFASAGSASSG